MNAFYHGERESVKRERGTGVWAAWRTEDTVEELSGEGSLERGKIISIVGHSIPCPTYPKTRDIWEKVLAKGEEFWPKKYLT